MTMLSTAFDSNPIQSVRDIAAALEVGAASDGLLLRESDLGAAFFDLRTGLAGELLQKFVSYRVPLAIVVASPSEHGVRFGELVSEHRAHPIVRFFVSAEEAAAWLDGQRPGHGVANA